MQYEEVSAEHRSNRIRGLISAREYAEALQLCDQATPKGLAEEADLLALRGRCQWFLGRYEMAQGDQKSAIEKYLQLGMHKEACLVTIDLGMTCDALPDYYQAITAFRYGYNLAKKIDMNHTAAASLASLGLVYARLGQHERALEDLAGADKLFQTENIPGMRSEFLSRAVPSHLSLNRLGDAQQVAERAMQLALASNRPSKVASAYRALALCATAREDWGESFRLFNKAHRMFQQENAEVEQARTDYEQGVMLIACFKKTNCTNARNQAIESLEGALRIYERREYVRRAMMVLNATRQISGESERV